MKVIVVIKPGFGGSGTSQAARYISTRERDESREGGASRPLFSEQETHLNHTQANQLLGGDSAPRTDDVLHLVISFQDEKDFHLLGASEEARLDGVRQVTRATLREMAGALDTRTLRWVAGIHRNTDNPHIHLLVHREYVERQTGHIKHMKTLPKEWRVRWEKAPNGTRLIQAGLFSQTFEKHLVQSIHHFQERQSARNEQQRQERTTLGQAMMVAERIQQAEEKLRAVEDVGEWRRYCIVDAQGRSRWLSEVDWQRRAALRTETNVHQSVLQKLRAARSADASALALQLHTTRSAAQPVLEAAKQVTERYAQEGKPLPTPLLSRPELSHLQQHALLRGDAEQVRQLEQIRVSLASEKGEPTRIELEMARLRAQLFVAHSGLAVEQQSAAHFEATKHLRAWRTSRAEQPTKQSLAQLEAARAYAADQAKFIGARRLHWDADERANAREQVAVLQQQRAEVLQQIDAERARLAAEIARRTETVKVLQELYAEEQQRYEQQGLALPASRFTEQEWRELDAHAVRRHDARFYQTLIHLERESDQRSGRAAQEMVRSRYPHALAREVMAEIAVRESAERLERFQERRSRWMVVTHDNPTMGLTLGRLSDVEPRAPLEELLRPWLTRTVKYRALASAVSAWEQFLQKQHEQNQAAHTFLSESAQQAARAFNQHHPGQALPSPHFTARELNQLEYHINKEANPALREKYTSLFQEALKANHPDAARAIRLDADEAKALWASDHRPFIANAEQQQEMTLER